MSLIKFCKIEFYKTLIAMLWISSLIDLFCPIELLAEVHPLSSDAEQIRFIPPASNRPSGENQGSPSDAREGPGSRGECIATDLPMTPLVGYPDLKLTVSDRPTFWVYVPYTSEQVTSGEFLLRDENLKDLQRIPFKLPQTPGVVRISLPYTTPPLEVGKLYFWSFEVSCPQASSSDEPTPASVRGSVERISISPAMGSQLNSANSILETIEIYAENGIWYDALTDLATLRINEPDNLLWMELWIDLLGSDEINLDSIAREKIVGDVSANSQ